MKLVAGNSNRPLAEAIAAYLEIPLAKCMVRRFADLSVTVDDGETVWHEGVPLVYTIELRNAGPDEAPGSRIVTAAVPVLTDVQWQCLEVGGAVCPVANGTGEIDLTVSLPAAGGLDLVYGGLVPNGWQGSVALGAQAIADTESPSDVYDFGAANDLAMDVDLPTRIFSDGFENGDTSAWTFATP